ncbi:MAG: DUF1592 domain-containing protein [Polyangiales bacterium]
MSDCVVRTTHGAFRAFLPVALLSISCTGTVDDALPGPRGALEQEPTDGEAAGRPSSAGDPSSPDGVGWTTRFPKLSNRQWENSVRSVLGLSAATGLSQSFTQEPLDKGYETEAAALLTVGGDAWSRYQTAAETVAQQVTADAAKLAAITPSGTFKDAAAKGAAFIASFGKRAFRRPLTSEETARYASLFAQGPALVGGDAYAAGARLVLEAMLQSPHFLYRVESSDDADKNRKVKLTGHEVATRLSYALVNDAPSEAMLVAADKGDLDEKAGVATWAGKLLDDPRAKDVLLAFHEQTFGVSSYGTQDKDPSLGFDATSLAPTLRDEARRFFERVVVEQGGGIAQVLTDPTVFVNEDTAKLYGLSGVSGKALVARTLDAGERAGLLTQVGFLSKNATRAGTDPVHRGLTVVRKVLCDDPDPPPMTFMLPSPVSGQTTREVYEQTTGACGGTCHRELINPPGFAFEKFDTLGRLRATEAGKAIDASGTISVREGYTSAEKNAGGKAKVSFDGPVALVTQLAAQPRVHECYARNWLSYVLARTPDAYERGAWEALADTSQERASARALLLALVQLDTFRYRVADAQ